MDIDDPLWIGWRDVTYEKFNVIGIYRAEN